jgi:hypothetical protein
MFAAGVFACAEAAAPPIQSPLAGLVSIDANDTVPESPAPQPSPTPGSFHGTVRGYEPGPDTLASAVKLPNVKVTAYVRISVSTDSIGTGTVAGSTLTDANGDWQLPTLPGDEYIVTFVPPEGSKYRGVWAIATAHSGSNQSPWFIMLAVK